MLIINLSNAISIGTDEGPCFGDGTEGPYLVADFGGDKFIVIRFKSLKQRRIIVENYLKGEDIIWVDNKGCYTDVWDSESI